MKQSMIKTLKFIVFFACYHLTATPPHVVTFFIDNYPYINQKNNIFNKGIFFTYFGYKTTSDNNGQVTFPLKTVNPSFYLLVTNGASPVFMLDNTISHWEVAENSTYMLFSVERKYDKNAKLHFWSVEQTELEGNLEIPLNTIIAHTNPESIYIRTGIFPTSDSPQLVLPTIFVKSSVKQLSENNLKFLEYCEFFAPIHHSFKITKDSRESKI